MTRPDADDPPSGPWVAATARCEACGHEWVAVRPLVTTGPRLQCPECGQMAGVDDGPRWPGTEGT